MSNDSVILLVDDHAVVRAGYRHLLQVEGGYTQVLEADSQQSALAICQSQAVDVVVCDISLPDPVGLGLLQRLLDRWPTLKVLMFTMHNSVELARACLDAGAKGYITKSSHPEVLLRALSEVLAGRGFVSADVSHQMALSRLSGHRSGLEQLSSREFEVLCMLVSGKHPEYISEALFLSAKTIQNIHYQIKKKLQVSSDIELTKLAIGWGLTSADPTIVGQIS